MASLNIPNTFTNGQTADALQVNANFTSVKSFAETAVVQTDGSVKATLAALAAEVLNKLVPVGTIAMYGGVSAPTGWLLCNGDAIDAGYTVLKSIVGNNTPDFKGRFALGDNATLNLLGTGGSVNIGTNNLPAHSHPNTASASTSVSISDPGHTHTYGTLTATGLIGGAGTTRVVVQSAELQTTNASGTGISASGSTSVTINNANTGGGDAYYQPHLVVNYIIKHD